MTIAFSTVKISKTTYTILERKEMDWPERDGVVAGYTVAYRIKKGNTEKFLTNGIPHDGEPQGWWLCGIRALGGKYVKPVFA